jgi:hypothetical protein
METAIYYFCAAYLSYVAIAFGLGLIDLWQQCDPAIKLPQKSPLETTQPIVKPIVPDPWFEVPEATLEVKEKQTTTSVQLLLPPAQFPHESKYWADELQQESIRST